MGKGESLPALHVEAEERQKAAARDRATAADQVKPLFDMLGIWNMQGTVTDPLADSDYATKTQALIQNWAVNKGLPMSLFLPGRSPYTPAEAKAEAASIVDKAMGLITVLNTIGIIAEAVSLGQIESVIYGMTNVINASGVPRIASDLYALPVETAIKLPLQRWLNANYQPNIPDIRSLVTVRSTGMLTQDGYNFWMREHGYSDWASEVMAYAAYRWLDINTMLTMWRRGIMDESYLDINLARGQLHPHLWPRIKQLRWELPGYADIISVYMREGYLEEKWVEIPTEFITFMDKLGYDNEWAKRLWGKHWVLPGVDHLYEMFWKKIITYDDMSRMLKYHDFEPVWRDRLIANAYRMIPRVDLRRAYRYGMLAAEGLTERYEKLGFNAPDAGVMSGIAQRESLDRYYTRLETAARAAFRKGLILEDEFRAILVEINTPATAITLILKAEKLAKEAALYDPGEQVQAPETVEVNRDLISAAAALFREGLMDPRSFAGYLRKAGLTEEEIGRKTDAEELRYRYDYLKDLITLAREGYKKDVYTASELESYLLAYGMQHERVKALSALEALRKMPKPKVAT